MFAVVEIKGKQYLICPNEKLAVDKLGDELKEGSELVFDKVLLLDDGQKVEIGTPYLENVTISAVFEEAIKGKKLIVFKMKRRNRSSVKRGHRQQYSRIKIGEFGKINQPSSKTEKEETKPQVKAEKPNIRQPKPVPKGKDAKKITKSVVEKTVKKTITKKTTGV